MKKGKKEQRDFQKLADSLYETQKIVRNTRNSKLWEHEASVRKKLRKLKALDAAALPKYAVVLQGYVALLDEISQRLLEAYNKKHATSFSLLEVTASDRAAYLETGIMAVLITSHIPAVAELEFNRYFPQNPKDEYPRARAQARMIHLHLGGTNTGKTFNAVNLLMKAESGVYLAPLRILALENYEKINACGVPCDLLTGQEEVRVEGARHVSSTVEKANLDRDYDVAVIDEIQMIGNAQRGQAWTRALLGLSCREIHVCGALNAKELLIRIIEDLGDSYDIEEYARETPLEVCEKPFELKKIQKGDALIAFSKKRVLELSRLLHEKGVNNSVIYGDLPPQVRRKQYRDFSDGESTVLVSTDAIGMGVNLPIRRIIFMDLVKFDGDEMRYITSQEVKQIGGRAGRKGIYETGFVGTAGTEQLFLAEQLEAKDEELQVAVVGPSEAILKVTILPLAEKLALWSTRKESLDYYRKMDVRDFLFILEALKPFRLEEKDQFELMRLPFDVWDSEIMTCFTAYVQEYFKDNCMALSRPKADCERLADLERHYKKLDLYYSFSKAFNLPFDEQWVTREREKTSEKISKLLLKL